MDLASVAMFVYYNQNCSNYSRLYSSAAHIISLCNVMLPIILLNSVFYWKLSMLPLLPALQQPFDIAFCVIIANQILLPSKGETLLIYSVLIQT